MKQSTAQHIVGRLGGTQSLEKAIEATNFLFTPHKGISFDFGGTEKFNHILITEDAADKFTLDFKLRTTSGNRKSVQLLTGVPEEKLREMVEKVTGLSL